MGKSGGGSRGGGGGSSGGRSDLPMAFTVRFSDGNNLMVDASSKRQAQRIIRENYPNRRVESLTQAPPLFTVRGTNGSTVSITARTEAEARELLARDVPGLARNIESITQVRR